MYIPPVFSETNQEILSRLIARFPLGMLFTAGSSGLMVSPIPFLYKLEEGKPTLVAHLAKANRHWKDLANLKECLVVFQGVGNYITPNWYASKKTTHQVVPTWNYEVVEVRGVPKVILSSVWLKNQTEELTNSAEEKRTTPWKVADAPADFIARELKGIVGLEIEVTAIQGKWKMSQNRTKEDAEGVIKGLSDPQDPHFNLKVGESVCSHRRKD